MRRLAFGLACVAAAGMPALAADPLVVSQKDRAFAVRSARIAQGGTIRFTNDDEFSHQVFVQSPGFSYESDEQQPGHAVDVTFPQKGTFDVQCRIHPKMHLHVDVR